MDKEFASIHRRLDALAAGGGPVAGATSGGVIPPLKVRDDAQCDALLQRLETDDAYRQDLVSIVIDTQTPRVTSLINWFQNTRIKSNSTYNHARFDS